MDLGAIRGFVFDLDGTIWSWPRLLPGAAELTADLRAAGIPIVFATNSSQKCSRVLAAALTRLGVPAEPRDVVAAFDLAAVEVRRRMGPVPVLTLGSNDLVESISGAGHEPLPFDRWADARAVVVGVDPEFNYARLRAASRAVAAGAAFFAVNMDARFPVVDGFDPGCGALAEAVATAARVRPTALGKPHPALFEEAISRLGCPADAAAIVGDSQASDIVGGASAGMLTIWVSPADDGPALVEPDLIVDDLPELHRLWRAARGPDS